MFTPFPTAMLQCPTYRPFADFEALCGDSGLRELKIDSRMWLSPASEGYEPFETLNTFIVVITREGLQVKDAWRTTNFPIDCRGCRLIEFVGRFRGKERGIPGFVEALRRDLLSHRVGTEGAQDISPFVIEARAVVSACEHKISVGL
jgi:hypothetical protein